MSTFVDTNILIYMLDPKTTKLHVWSRRLFEDRKARGPIIISDIVYCELSAGMPDQSTVDAAVRNLGLERIRGNDAALFRAGEAFKRYKNEHKGKKTNVLPDFIIGAVAEIERTPLLTANPGDFAGYFPNLRLIHP